MNGEAARTEGREIRLPRSLVEAIAAQGRREAPLEACGYCAGVDGEVRELLPLRNADQSPEHFSFDPRDQFASLKTARQKGLQLVAVYHSHPVTPPRMSAEDIRLANDPSMVYLIYSIAMNELRGFAVDDRKQVLPVAVRITSDPGPD